MKRILSVRSAIFAVVMIAAILGTLTAFTETEAFLGVCTYYSNAKYKSVVGQRGTGCCGESINWGQVTEYRKCEQLYCLDVWCPPPTE